MNRREFITLLGGAAAAWPLAAWAQQSGRIARIGILSTANPRSSSFYQSFERRLRDLGHIEGQNIIFEYRNAEGEADRLPDLAAELARLDSSIIVSATAAATSAVKQATSTIPILVVAVNYDPIALGYVDNLARPGGNVTGLFFQHLELLAKRFGLFKRGRVPRQLWYWSLRPSFAAALRSCNSQRIIDYRRALHFVSTLRSVV
jgi:putative ABC transport system substrate-binding protein